MANGIFEVISGCGLFICIYGGVIVVE